MKRLYTEDEYFVKCDIVTGRLYRCLVGLFQDFIEIQLSTALGEKWLDKIVELAKREIGNLKGSEKNTLIALLGKKDEVGVTMDKTAIDVTIANSFMLHLCYYLVAVPQYHLKKDDAIEIISKNEHVPVSDLQRLDDEALHQRLLALINKDIKVVLECQDKMSGFERNKKTGKDDFLVKNKYIKNNDFYKKVMKLVNDKNELNSHMSEVNDYRASMAKIIDMLRDLEDFLKFLDIVWDHPDKDDLVARYRDELAVARHLFGTPALNEVTDIINNTISKFQGSKLPESKKYVLDPAELIDFFDFPEGS